MSHFFLVPLVAVLCSLILVNGNPLKEDAHEVYQCPDPSALPDTPALCKLTVQEYGHFLTTLTKEVRCPETAFNKAKLACIIVKNLDDDDKGGYATIERGGLNDYSVEIRLKSQFGKGLNFQIEVYTV